MQLVINGNKEDCTAATVADMLTARGHDPKTVVVERNGTIVPAADFTATPLQDGDSIEIVQFVGGG